MTPSEKQRVKGREPIVATLILLGFKLLNTFESFHRLYDLNNTWIEIRDVDVVINDGENFTYFKTHEDFLHSLTK